MIASVRMRGLTTRAAAAAAADPMRLTRGLKNKGTAAVELLPDVKRKLWCYLAREALANLRLLHVSLSSLHVTIPLLRVRPASATRLCSISPCNCARLSLRFENTEMAWVLAARNLRVGLLDWTFVGLPFLICSGCEKLEWGSRRRKVS